MHQTISHSGRSSWLRPILFPVIVGLIVVLAGGILIDRQNTYLNVERARTSVTAQAALVRAKLEGNINGNIQLVRGLVATIATEPNMNQDRFSALVGNLMEEQSQLRAIAAAPNLVVTMIYPVVGNQAAIGLNYRDNPEQSVEAMLARDSGRLVLAGPVDLVQGGRGFIGRFPVYIDGPAGTKFWGVVSAVVDVYRLYADSGLSAETSDIEISLTAKNAAGQAGERFFGADLSGQNPVIADVIIPSGSWQIAAIPKGGWASVEQGSWQVRLALIVAGGLILLPIFITGHWISERQVHYRESKSREAILERLSRRLTLALETSQVGVWEMDVFKRDLVWDERMKQIYGQNLESDHHEYALWQNAVHPDDLARCEADLAGGITKGSYRSDFRIIRPDGEMRYIRAQAAIFHDLGSTPKILGINWDVTADVTLTDRLKAREGELVRLSRRLSLALDVSKVGVWELDVVTGTHTWDERMFELYGALGKSAPRNTEHWLTTVHPDDRDRVSKEFTQAFATGSHSSTFRVLQADGAVRHIRSVAALHVEPDAHDRFIGVDWDITADIQLNDELRVAQQLTEARNLELEAARSSIEYNALHDVVTGLPNRRYLDEKISAMRSGSHDGSGGLALLHLDLDRFKQINDTLGHAAGDAMLVHASNVLLANCRDGDFVARVGGDEFVLLTTTIDGDIRLATLAERIVKQMRQPVSYEGHQCRFGVSIGIATERGQEIDSKRLLINADIALYRAKARGRNRFEFFSDALQAEVVNTKRIADEILSGLERAEFGTYYQPQFDAHTLDIVGVEALARWHHPTEGVKTPDSFLPIAEELNVVSIIDRLILEQALADLDRWQAKGLHVPRASVNVSLRRLHDEDLINGLRELAIAPGRIAFELVESIYLDESDAIVGWNIEQFKALGIDVEIDDFGTGYASIVSLQKLRPRRLKIDRQLVAPILTDLAQRKLLVSIIDIGKSMNIEIVAEGVETMEHARILRDLGCDILQGYAFARPMNADGIEALLRAQSWRPAQPRITA